MRRSLKRRILVSEVLFNILFHKWNYYIEGIYNCTNNIMDA